MVMNRAKLVLSAIGLIVSLFIANIAFSENKTFIKEYTYMASDIDSKVSSRAIALEQVKRALLEQLGTYLISETEVKNYQMNKDQITTLTAGIVSAEVVEEKWDGRSYYLKAMIAADPKEVAKSLDALRTDVQKSKELEDTKNKAEEAMREVERLTMELELVKGDTRKQRDYANAIKNLSTTDWIDKGLVFIQSKNYMGAVEAFNKAIELNPNDASTYYNLGHTYQDLGNHQQALNDYNKAIELNPKLEVAYNNRGVAYGKLGNYQLALNDYNKAIELNPKFAGAYSNRGNAYGKLGNHQLALKDYNKAIELNPKFVVAMYNMACIYSVNANSAEACKWLRTSVEKGFNNWKHIKEDNELDNIRSSSCYKEIMKGK